MGFFKRLADLFTPIGRSDDNWYWLTVKCDRCGEIIRARVNKYNDLSVQYDGKVKTYHCRKLLIGDKGECFQRVEVEMTFNANRKLIDHKVTGGQFIDR